MQRVFFFWTRKKLKEKLIFEEIGQRQTIFRFSQEKIVRRQMEGICNRLKLKLVLCIQFVFSLSLLINKRKLKTMKSICSIWKGLNTGKSLVFCLYFALIYHGDSVFFVSLEVLSNLTQWYSIFLLFVIVVDVVFLFISDGFFLVDRLTLVVNEINWMNIDQNR